MAIPKGITKADVLNAIRDFDRGVAHPYGSSTKYDLIHDGGLYPPKAIVGLAARRLNRGRVLDPDADFSGGAGPSAANRVLIDLGFAVAAKSSPNLRPGRPSDWTVDEIETVLPEYFALLHDELDGRFRTKRTIVADLEARLPRRTRGSIEYKFENVSAILLEQGLPWIDGYKPATRYQHLLRELVLGRLDGPRDERTKLLLQAARAEHAPTAGRRADREVDPPRPTSRRRIRRPNGHGSSWRGAEADSANRLLGLRGEEWIVELEREILTDAGRSDLASRVEQASVTKGDGLGYDVLSFRPDDGSDLWLEVKTTNAGPSAAFLLTRNELEVWRRHQGRYQIVRLYYFSGSPSFYRLEGDPDTLLELDSALYRATLSPTPRS